MASSVHSTFTDPEHYQSAVQPAQVEVLVTAKGDFEAAITRIELPRLWVQRGRESLPRVANSTASPGRPPIFFLTDADQSPISHSGRELAFGEIAVAGSGATHHHRTEGPTQWGTMSVMQDELAAAGQALVGGDVIERSVTRYLRPTIPTMSRLLNLHKAATGIAEGAADILARPEPARALEQSLLHALITCLGESTPIQMGSAALRHTAIIARFEEVLAANYSQPLYLAEICATIGTSERMLRISCMEHLGIGPVRYLWLRRMHLARHSLLMAAPGTATVTEIATGNGFFELGRFAVEYRALFGEAPSASLRRPAKELRRSKNGPFSFADSEYA